MSVSDTWRAFFVNMTCFLSQLRAISPHSRCITLQKSNFCVQSVYFITFYTKAIRYWLDFFFKISHFKIIFSVPEETFSTPLMVGVMSRQLLTVVIDHIQRCLPQHHNHKHLRKYMKQIFHMLQYILNMCCPLLTVVTRWWPPTPRGAYHNTTTTNTCVSTQICHILHAPSVVDCGDRPHPEHHNHIQIQVRKYAKLPHLTQV
jgi:hypothetical protein